MARYVRDFPMAAPPEPLFNAIYSYLLSEGYEYRQFENENVFKKGMGLMTGPTFIKVSFGGNMACLEAWMKYALLPGVYVGEIGLTGFVGSAVKGPLKRRVAQIEAMILQYGSAPIAGAPVNPQVAPIQSTASGQPVPPRFCAHCGTPLTPGATCCSNCGKAV